MSSPATSQLRGMDIFGFLNVDAEEQRRAGTESKFEAHQGSISYLAQPASIEGVKLVKAKIGRCDTREEFELSVRYLTNCGAGRIRDLMIMAGLPIAESAAQEDREQGAMPDTSTIELSQQKFVEQAASTDNHDKVRLLAIELINKVIHASNSEYKQSETISQHDMVMEKLCTGVARLKLEGPVRLDSKHAGIYDHTNFICVASTEELGSLEPSNLPSWSCMYDEITAFASWKPFFASKILGVNSPVTSPATSNLPSWSCIYDEIKAFPSWKAFFQSKSSGAASTGTSPASISKSTQTWSVSSSSTAPVPSPVPSYIKSAQINSVSSHAFQGPCPSRDMMIKKTLAFGLPNNPTGLFSGVDTSLMDGSPCNANDEAKPASHASTQIGSPALSNPNFWSSIQAQIGTGSRFATASSKPILQSTPTSSPTTSIKPKTATFSFAGTTTGLFRDVDTSAMDDDSSSTSRVPKNAQLMSSGSTANGNLASDSTSSWPSSSNVSSWNRMKAGGGASLNNAPASSPVISDGEDIVMSDFEDMEYEMDTCPPDHEVNANEPRTAAHSLQANLEVLRDVQVLATPRGKRKRNAPISSHVKRTRRSPSPLLPVRSSKVISVQRMNKLPSTPAISTTPTKLKPTSFVPPTQYVHKSSPKRSKTRRYCLWLGALLLSTICAFCLLDHVIDVLCCIQLSGLVTKQTQDIGHDFSTREDSICSGPLPSCIDTTHRLILFYAPHRYSDLSMRVEVIPSMFTDRQGGGQECLRSGERYNKRKGDLNRERSRPGCLKGL
ncbi:hypothetical protein FKW77_001934 [Venturia effusa]|uniref:Uncharacterized protein n=1 Tax=Venturia effusa TaxID=50376 RepID=A0A517LMA7_9PEZI|nr:hypothetical protein FKW77_001934 [Venturia effusa]